MNVGLELATLLQGRACGEQVALPRPLKVSNREFRSVVIAKEFRTKSGACLLRLDPGGCHFICKFEDLFPEYAVMAALRRINSCWRKRGLSVCGQPIQAVTFDILPLGPQFGLVEVVKDSKTLRELGEGLAYTERQFRVAEELKREAAKLDRLAASTVAYLTSTYALGVRDGHDDNLMLRSDGSLFRVDFGFAFGRTPEIDAPGIFVPNAVAVALGDARWRLVVAACSEALRALGEGQPPVWDCLRQVSELKALLPDAHRYTEGLSFQAFHEQVSRAADWSFQRAAKNTLREAVRYVTAETEVQNGDSGSWFGLLDPLGAILGNSSPSSAGAAAVLAGVPNQGAPPARGQQVHAQGCGGYRPSGQQQQALPTRPGYSPQGRQGHHGVDHLALAAEAAPPGAVSSQPWPAFRGWGPAVPATASPGSRRPSQTVQVKAAPPLGAGGLRRGY